MGFGKLTVIDSRNSIRSEETFLQNAAEYQAIGVPSLTQLKQSSGTLIAETTNTWNKVTYSSGTSERRFPYVSQQVMKRWEAEGTYNGSLIRTATTTNSVDSTSGIIYDSTTATVEAATANGIQASASYSARVYHPTAYMLNDTSSNWCIGRPGRTELTNSHTQYGGSAITRTYSRTWNTTDCRVTQEITEPDSTTWKVTRDVLYDGWGNVNSDAITGIGMAARTTTASYASTNGRFLGSVTNALSQATQFAWDATIGTLTSMTDPNGIVTSWQYDVFGRRTKEDRPDSTDTTVSYNDCSGLSGGCLNANNKLVVIVTRRDTSDGFVNDQWTYLDKLDRPLATKNRMLSGSYNRIEQQYDSYGNVSQQASPCWAASCTAYWTTYSYDLLNRAKAISRPTSDSDPTPATINIYFEGLTARTVDALSKQSTKVANVLGGLAKSTDHDGYYQAVDVDGFGNIVRVTDSLSNTLQTITYNVQGVKTAQTDMDLGAWTYLPNALGELTNIRDAKTTAPAWTTVIGYDLLGRMTSRQDVPEAVTSTWTWGTSAHNDATHKYIGGLKSLAGAGYSETYTNDAIGRRATTQIVSDATYNIDYAYSAIGALDTLTYPTSTSGYRLKLQYDYQNGLLRRVKDYAAPTTEFWTANDTDPRGHVINETLENGLQTIRGFDLVTGLLDSITTGPGGSGTIQNLSYAWDKVGNLTQRQDLRQTLTENFYYDNLHRLTSSTGPDPITLTYDAMGNIQTKTGIAGSYTYHATKKPAVTAAGSFTFAYDANGNASTRNGFPVTWYSYNLPNTISASGSNSSQFFYAPDRSRWKQVAIFGGTTETTIYIGGLVEKVTLGAVTSWKHYIAGGSGPVAIYTRKSGAADEMHYLTRDHLGSVDSVTNGSGAVEVRLSYGAFGQRRKEAGWSGNPTSGDWTEITDSTRRGFTLHEMLDNLNLTHMNGRVYDQIVGRFISADPFIPEPGITQSFNRYSYVRNSPATLIDPSGHDDSGSQLVHWQNQNEPTDAHNMGGITTTSTRIDYSRDLNFNQFAFAERSPVNDTRNREFQGGGGEDCDVLETVAVEDTRLEDPAYIAPPGWIEAGVAPRVAEIGGSDSGRSQRDNCIADCNRQTEPFVQAFAGLAAGGAAGGLLGTFSGGGLAIPTAIIGALMGAATGLLTGSQGVPVAVTAGFGSGATFITSAVAGGITSGQSAAASLSFGAAGAAIGASTLGPAWTGAAAGVSSITATAGFAPAVTIVAAAAAAGAAAYNAADSMRDAHCQRKCGVK